MKAYELTEDQIRLGGSELSDLAHECGYSSLKSCLNDNNWWSLEVEKVKAELQAQIEGGDDE